MTAAASVSPFPVDPGKAAWQSSSAPPSSPVQCHAHQILAARSQARTREGKVA